MTWQEDFLDEDTAAFVDGNGVEIGSVRRRGGSWECRYGEEVIAIRPDKKSALGCVTKYHLELVKGAAHETR
jgi:hypothetical protein